MSCIGYQKFYQRKRGRRSDLDISTVPSISLDDPLAAEKARFLYDKYQLLHLRSEYGCSQAMRDRVISIISHYPDIVSKSLTVENGIAQSSLADVQSLLKESTTSGAPSSSKAVWYVSFILQENQDLLNEFLGSEIYQQPSFFPLTSSDHQSDPNQDINHNSSKAWHKLSHTSPIWLFFGRNLSPNPLRGRVEHTDSVSHDGTWHRQVSGEKVWYLRPVEESQEWMHGCPRIHRKRNHIRRMSSDTIVRDESKVPRLRILCRANDILIINTRLWWHSTEIPNTESAADQISVSFARDFYLHDAKESSEINSMTNIDGLYAAKSVSIGDVVLTEAELPNCSLPRDPNANCMVAELDDGTMALIARRSIRVGDWLAVLPSDDEDED